MGRFWASAVAVWAGGDLCLAYVRTKLGVVCLGFTLMLTFVIMGCSAFEAASESSLV